MKYVIIALLASVLAGQVDSLSFEQKREYNRQKLSIEIIGQSIGFNPGIKGGTIGSTEWHRWTAYQGIGKQLTESEFFALTGYHDEAQKAEDRTKKIKGTVRYGGILAIGGLALAIAVDPQAKTLPIEAVPFLIASIVGGGMVLAASRASMRNYTPVSLAQQIADDYNQQLINRIANE